MHLVQRAEDGKLLSGEAVLLREAVELLDDMVGIMDRLMSNPGALDAILDGRYVVERVTADDDAPGRP